MTWRVCSPRLGLDLGIWSDPGGSVPPPPPRPSQRPSRQEARNTRKFLSIPPNHIANTFPALSALDVMECALTLSLYYQHTSYGIWMIFETRVQPHSTSGCSGPRSAKPSYLPPISLPSSAQHRRSHARNHWTANGALIDHTLIPHAFLILEKPRILHIFYTEWTTLRLAQRRE